MAWTGQVGVMQIEFFGNFLTSERDPLYLGPIFVLISSAQKYSIDTLPRLLVSYIIAPIWIKIWKN